MIVFRLTAVLILCATTASGAEPRLDRLEPQGVRRGADATVHLHGGRLGKEPQELVFYEPGVEVLDLQAKGDNQVVAKLRLAEGCPLGRHAVRVRTATGLSNLRTLHVGALETVGEAEPNNTLDQAQAIPFNRTVHGVVKREDEDVFAVEAVEGQRISIEVDGLRLGRTFFDPCVEVLDASGAVIAENDDQRPSYSDPFLTVTAPAAGLYYVRLRESAFRGDDRSTYLLHIGDFPRPTAVYPPVAVRGAESSVRWIGAPGEQAVPAPETTGETFDAHAADDGGVAPTGMPLWVAEAAPTLEAEPNNKREKATALPWPGVAAGVIGEPRDIDHFRVTVKKGDTLELRVRARKLRSPLDAVLRVFDAGGKRLAGNDDERGYPDPYIRFKAPADGDYVLQVEDQLRRGGEGYTYAMEVRPVRGVAELKIEERRRYEATTVDVPRGGRTAVLMRVNRRDSSDKLRLGFDALPGGVSAETFPLESNFNVVPVVFSAADDANLAASLSPVSASVADGSENPVKAATTFHQQTWLVRGRNNRPVWSHFADRAAVSVTERLPFSIEAVQPLAPLPKNGSMHLKVVAKRDEGFDRPISVKLLYHSPGMSSNRSRSVPKGKLEASIPVTTNWQARTGDWPMVVIAETNIDGRVYASSQFVNLRVVDPYFDVNVPVAQTRQGESIEFAVNLKPRTDFAGPATIELRNLPPGVSADPVTVERGAESATFQLAVASDARAARHKGVHVVVRLTDQGEPVEYRQGWSDMQIDPAQPRADQTAMKARKEDAS